MKSKKINGLSILYRSFAHRLTFFLILYLIICWLLIFLPLPSHAQQSPIVAEVNGTQFSTDELVILKVIVIDDSPQQPLPILPHLDGLAVVDLDISTNVNLIDGEIHTEVTYTYFLQPRSTGLLTIPPVTVKIDNQTYKAAPISINIHQGAAPAPSTDEHTPPTDINPPSDLEKQDFYVESTVNYPKPYLGQQIIHTFRFYQAIQIYQEPQYEEPRFNGFDTLGLSVREFNLDVGDRTYLITEIRTALFPKTSGTLNIEPNRLMIPGNFHEDPIELYTQPVKVEVQPLPNKAPEGFNGAVGQFEVKAWFSPEVAIVKQPSTFFVSVNGSGNIQNLPEPIWPELNGWQAYTTLTSLTTEPREDGIIAGTRVYERLVIPNQVGDFTISEAKFVYFDPTTTEYKTITTSPLSVKIIPPPTPDASSTFDKEPTPTPASIAVITNPEEKTSPPETSLNPEANWSWIGTVLLVLGLGICTVIPTIILTSLGGLWFWQQKIQTPISSISKTSYENNGVKREEEPESTTPKIHPVLATAMKENDDNYKAVSQALNKQLGDILGVPINGLTRTQLITQLREYGFEKNLTERIEDCFIQSEMGQYTPLTEGTGWELMGITDKLLFDLDKIIANKRID